MEISTRTIETTRLNHYCRIAGNPEDLPVLLLHGSFASSRWWEPFMSLMPDGFYMVAPDLRGCGKTGESVHGARTEAAAADDYAIAAQAADVAALVDSLGWDEFELVGHSSGGAIAVEYALTQFQGVRTLTLIDSAPIEGVFTPMEMLMVLDQMRTDRALLRHGLAALMPTYPTGVDAQSSDAPPFDAIDSDSTEASAMSASPRFFEQLVDDAAQMAPTAFIAVAEALNQWNRFADAGALTLPTLLVWGELDTVVDRDSMTRSLIAIPGAGNLEVLRNVGHSPMLEAPVTLAERFIEFVTDDLDDYAQVRRDAY
ncbi:MAG: alpha/beta hydrolase [Litorilinea sp.]